jgi:hypothetical protein
MDHHLAGRPHRAHEARAADDVVEALLEEAQQDVAGVALVPRGLLDVTTELRLHDAVVEAELLLLHEADAEVLEAPAAEPVRAGRRQLSLGRVLGDVGDGDADAAGELDLGAGVSSHSRVVLEMRSGAGRESPGATASRVVKQEAGGVSRSWVRLKGDPRP